MKLRIDLDIPDETWELIKRNYSKADVRNTVAEYAESILDAWASNQHAEDNDSPIYSEDGLQLNKKLED